MLTSSSGTNYVPNEHEDVDQYDPYAISSEIMKKKKKAMLKLSCKFGESKLNPCWLVVLTSSTGTNYGLNDHEDFDQFGSFKIPSKIMPY